MGILVWCIKLLDTRSLLYLLPLRLSGLNLSTRLSSLPVVILFFIMGRGEALWL